MLKSGVIAAEQEQRFGPIWVSLIDEDVDEAIADLTEMYGPGSAGTSAEPGALLASLDDTADGDEYDDDAEEAGGHGRGPGPGKPQEKGS